ncbi:toprim domain-containing protein [Methylobacterium sp. Leaf361]|uniref:DUF7146 domain-containing protein n=1 Tax=Methylobacterium sp. Leaf361 TaxID=1736352 RepID=UPI000B26FF1F|nr:toprim domain-containing protein [Methylobacterium sp. Leaf361]
MLTLQQFAADLRGKVVSGGVSFAPPGHGPRDGSGRLRLDPSARNGYRITCLSPRDDAIQVRDYVDERCGLPRWDERQRRPDPHEVARQERAREQQRLIREAEARIKVDRVRRIWDEAERDPRGTLVARYLAEHRHLDLAHDVCGHAIRFHPAGPWEGERVPMMLCGFRDIATDELVGLHRTRLDPATAAKIDRKMLGRAGGAAIKLTQDADVMTGLHLAEGVETALAGMALGFRPMWALGSVGGIAAFPLMSGIEALTICAETGEASQAAVNQVGTRWSDAGREVLIAAPKTGSDLNDAIREAMR